jgi:unsaturated rhamnogalacturonyl hydrolase
MTALWRDAAKKEQGYPAKWTYDHGLVLKGIERVWNNTGDKRYFNFIQQEHRPLRRRRRHDPHV